jgi:hypothetical protein
MSCPTLVELVAAAPLVEMGSLMKEKPVTKGIATVT